MTSPVSAPQGVRSAEAFASAVFAVGNTPVVRLRSLEAQTEGSEIYLKLEYMNPGGSVKDRAARQIILDAIAAGHLGDGQTLIDATSGNTGVAYSMIGAALGIPVALVMPSNVSAPRKAIVKAYGAKLIESDPMLGSDGAITHCKALVDASPGGYFYADQYSNPSNPMAHVLSTGPEIKAQLGDRLTHVVLGLGTSGTCMGTTRYMREALPAVKCIAMQPADALHGLEGLKHMESSIKPAIFDASVPDAHCFVGTEDGWDMAEQVAETDGLHVGHSSGANIYAALQVAKAKPGARVVTIACDRGDRYFSPLKWEQQYVW